MAACESILRIVFADDEGAKAELTLAAECGNAIGQELPPYVPGYIGREGSVNVPFVCEKRLIDSCAPVMVYLGDDGSLSPILLLEETKYELKLAGDIDSAFSYLTENSREVALSKLYFKTSGEDALYTLCFKSYVGKGMFDVTVGGKRLSVPFEVRSKKIDYLKDYPLMLRDISEFSTSLLLEVSSPLHGEYGLGDSRNDSLYEDFMLLDYVFNKMDLCGAYAQACTNRHCEMASFSERVPAGMARGIDPSDLPDLISAGNLTPMAGGPVAGRFAPLYATDRSRRDDYDTPENRVVKDLLLTVQKMVCLLISRLEGNVSAYVENRLREMGSEIDRMAGEPWLEDVGELDRIPFESTVLQRRAGYSDLFGIYQVIGLGAMFRQDDMEGLLRGQSCRVYQVYEYWCYIRLYRCLCSMSEDRPPFPLSKDGGRWTMTIRRDRKAVFRIPVERTEAEVALLYNKGFSQRDGGYRSYSVDLRPDFTVIAKIGSEPGRVFMINLDAKYKAKPKEQCDVEDEEEWDGTDCWEFDICKMHTYRDALLHSFGSYVLYPGSSGVLYPKPLKDEDWPRRRSLVIPSVGAIPLVPGSDRDEELEDTLRSILSAMAGYSTGTISLEPEPRRERHLISAPSDGPSDDIARRDRREEAHRRLPQVHPCRRQDRPRRRRRRPDRRDSGHIRHRHVRQALPRGDDLRAVRMVFRSRQLQRPGRHGRQAHRLHSLPGPPDGPGRSGRLRHHERHRPVLRVLRHRHRRRGHQARPRDRLRHRPRDDGRQAPHAPLRRQAGGRGGGHRPPGLPRRSVHCFGARHRRPRGQGFPLCPDPTHRRRRRHGRLRGGDVMHGPVRRIGHRSQHIVRSLRRRHGHRARLHPQRRVGGRDVRPLRKAPRRPPPGVGRGVRAALHRRQGQIGQALRR